MTNFKLAIGTCLIAALSVACSKMNSASTTGAAESPSSQLVSDRFAMDQLLANAGVVDPNASSSADPSMPPPTGSLSISCDPASGSAGSVDPSAAFANLQADIQKLIQDAEAQNSANLDADMQQFQADLLADLSSIESQIQACIQNLGPIPQPGNGNIPPLPQPGINIPPFPSFPFPPSFSGSGSLSISAGSHN